MTSNGNIFTWKHPGDKQILMTSETTLREIQEKSWLYRLTVLLINFLVLIYLVSTGSKKYLSHICFVTLYHIIITQARTTQYIPEHISIIHKSHATTRTMHIQTSTLAYLTSGKLVIIEKFKNHINSLMSYVTTASLKFAWQCIATR